jgi:DNA-binding NarL/FixJ family response regulator
MKAVFLSPSGVLRPRWAAAFPEAAVVTAPEAVVPASLVFVELGACLPDQAERFLGALIGADVRLVAMSDTPTEAEAYSLLARGVHGYCHVEAVPEQLQAIAQVVSAGGYWMPPGLLQRVGALATRVEATPPAAGDLNALTPREREVAQLVGRGRSNREIAEALDLSERSVKAALTVIFSKLDLRDRVQLALYVNRLPVQA